VYLHLYVLLDIFSRYVVGWMIADRESAALAERFLKETIEKYEDVDPERLTTHSDRGSAMRSLTVAQLLANMDVTQSFSRPRVSNDNPFSESQFKTIKYHPTFPDRFTGLDHGLDFGRQFFPWYNEQHHHSGLAYLTPATVHFGRTEEVLAARDATLLDAYQRHPERFRVAPKAPRPPPVVYINAPPADATEGPGEPERGTSDPHQGSPLSQAQPLGDPPTHGPDPTAEGLH